MVVDVFFFWVKIVAVRGCFVCGISFANKWPQSEVLRKQLLALT